MNDTNLISNRIEIISRNKIIDNRGWFIKVINGREKHLPQSTGEVYVVCSKGGGIRGGHYHVQATEWFTLIEGKAYLELYSVDTGEEYSLELDSDTILTVVVPPKIAHRFSAINNDSFLVIAYTNLLYTPEDTISFEF